MDSGRQSPKAKRILPRDLQYVPNTDYQYKRGSLSPNKVFAQ